MQKQFVTLEIYEPTPNEKIGLMGLNCPDAFHAMTLEMADQFRRLIKKLRRERSVRVLVLTGTGKTFSSGTHIDLLTRCLDSGEQETLDLLDYLYRSFLILGELEIPTIAAINGPAIGAGAVLALLTDIRIMAENAKIGFNFSRIGVFPGMGATFLAASRLGAQNALYLLLSGKVIDAPAAMRMGFALEMVPDDTVLDRAMEVAREIAETAPVVNRLLKKLFSGNQDKPGSMEEALAYEAMAQSLTFRTDDFKNAVKTIQNKGKEIKFLGY